MLRLVKGTGSIESINQSFGFEISPISAKSSGMMTYGIGFDHRHQVDKTCKNHTI